MNEWVRDFMGPLDTPRDIQMILQLDRRHGSEIPELGGEVSGGKGTLHFIL